MLISFLLSVLAGIVATISANGLTDEKKATSLGVKPCLHNGNRKAPKLEPWGLFVCRNANLVCQAHYNTSPQ